MIGDVVLELLLIIKSIAAAAQKKEARPNLVGLLVAESNTERIRWAILYALAMFLQVFPGAKKTTARE